MGKGEFHLRPDPCNNAPDRALPVSDPDVSRPRLIRDARFLEAGRREIALWRGRHNRLGFVYPVAFVRVLGRWKNVILYREIKIDPAPLKMRDPERVFLYESGQYPVYLEGQNAAPRE